MACVWTRTGKNLLIRKRLSARGRHVPNRTRNTRNLIVRASCRISFASKLCCWHIVSAGIKWSWYMVHKDTSISYDNWFFSTLNIFFFASVYIFEFSYIPHVHSSIYHVVPSHIAASVTSGIFSFSDWNSQAKDVIFFCLQFQSVRRNNPFASGRTCSRVLLTKR